MKKFSKIEQIMENYIILKNNTPMEAFICRFIIQEVRLVAHKTTQVF